MGQEAVEALQAPAKLWALSGALYVHHQCLPVMQIRSEYQSILQGAADKA